MPDCDGLYEDWLNEQDSKLTQEELEAKYPFLGVKKYETLKESIYVGLGIPPNKEPK